MNMLKQKERVLMENEKRLTDANLLVDWLTKSTGFRGNCENCTDIDCLDCIIEECIKNFPTVDAVEVVHGRWEHDLTGCYFNVKCTACGVNAISVNTTFFGYLPTVSWNYCPNCGAKMDGDGND